MTVTGGKEVDKAVLKKYLELYKKELFDSCIPFWVKSEMLDRENGGIFTSLTRDGKVYSRDKSIWFQGRCLWVFSRLTGLYGEHPEWREIMDSCKRFMDAYGFDTDGRMFFSVTEDGRPLRKRRYFFSETFYIIGNAEYALVTGDEKAMADARRVWDFVMAIHRDPEADPFKLHPKVYSSTRPTRAFANPMILLNVTDIMRRCDPENREKYEATAAGLAEEIVRYFVKDEEQLVLESVGPNGEFLKESSSTRVLNPGHAIEGAFFLMNQAEYADDEKLFAKAIDMMNWSLKAGWDEEHGGIVYYADALGFPPTELEARMKLWWPHNEAICATLCAWKHTGDAKYFDWFERLTEYSFSRFPDPEYGEWYGILCRDGSVSVDYKGNIYKGPFHTLRMLLTVCMLLEECLR